MTTALETAILQLDDKLKKLSVEYVFLGGSVLSLLVSDPSADAIRVTKDVDVMLNIRTRAEYHRFDRLLESAGFKHDTREEAPICRWIYKDVTVDILPIREEVLGWKSKWFEQALNAPSTVECGGRLIRTISAPYFVALKLEAFEDRGAGDFLTSTDFEDVICLFNGRPTLLNEILACPELCSGLSAKFANYLKSPDLEDAVEGFVQTESKTEQRKTAILNSFKRLASISAVPPPR